MHGETTEKEGLVDDYFRGYTWFRVESSIITEAFHTEQFAKILSGISDHGSIISTKGSNEALSILARFGHNSVPPDTCGLLSNSKQVSQATMTCVFLGIQSGQKQTSFSPFLVVDSILIYFNKMGNGGIQKMDGLGKSHEKPMISLGVGRVGL